MTPNDEKQLNLLSTLHYVAAAIAAPIPLFGAAYGVVTDAANCMHFPLGPPSGHDCPVDPPRHPDRIRGDQAPPCRAGPRAKRALLLTYGRNLSLPHSTQGAP